MMAPGQSGSDVLISVPVTLRRTGACVHRLGQAVLELEQQIIDIDATAQVAAKDVTGLQVLDRLKQATDDVAAFLDRLADLVPASTAVDRAALIDPLKLEELRDAIGDGRPPEEQQKIMMSGKAIELF